MQRAWRKGVAGGGRSVIGLCVLGFAVVVMVLAVFSRPHRIAPYLPSRLYTLTLGTRPTQSLPPPIDPHVHPIAQLTKIAETKWHHLLARQSRTLQECAAEYRARHGRNPPKGFDIWWEYSRARGLVLTDEFDQIHKDLAPFWGLSPRQITQRHDELMSIGSDRFLSVTIKNGTVGDEPGPASSDLWPLNRGYFDILKDVAPYLPDMRWAVNLHDTPVVFVSWEERQRLIEAGRKGVFASDHEEIPLPAEEVAKSPHQALSFIDLRAACPPGTPGRQYSTDPFGDEIYPNTSTTDLSFRLPDAQGGFIHDVSKQMDVCHNPSLKDQHGYFLKPDMNPRGLKRNKLYPMFSWTRFPQSSDIMIPTTYRFDHSTGKDGTPWNALIPKVSWRGSLTGIWPDDSVDAFASQRWRLWALVQDRFRRLSVLVSSAAANALPTFHLSTIKASTANQEWMDAGPVSFYADVMNETIAGKVGLEQFRMIDYMLPEERNKFKIFLDIDGWGWSARFRELLRTQSAVIKTTVYQEAFTDWLVPWYHYIPVSYAYEDLYSVLMYYLGSPDNAQEAHDEELRLVGRRGMEWADEHASWDQFTTYTLRLGLEWARLMSDDRSSMDYLG